MGNGSDPPRLLPDSSYQTIKLGSHVDRGTYKGCIKVALTYYWIKCSRDGDTWELNSGTPDASQTEITADVWAKCKDGGSLTWNSTDEVWEGGGNSYRWAGPTSGGYVALKEL